MNRPIDKIYLVKNTNCWLAEKLSISGPMFGIFSLFSFEKPTLEIWRPLLDLPCKIPVNITSVHIKQL